MARAKKSKEIDISSYMGFMMGAGGGGGEIVQVQGGHIVRSTGRKDRHSKIYTSKGPRDRRVRLSAHTAIQFYDVQDRLGFDRPSKAVDWLIRKAKSSIDKLVELPPRELANVGPLAAPPPPQLQEVSPSNGRVDSAEELRGDGRGSESPDDGYDFSIHRNSATSFSSSLFPSQIDTMLFFGTSSAVGASSSINFDDCHHSSNNQDLGLSLHPFHAPSFGSQHEDHIHQSPTFTMTADYLQSRFAARQPFEVFQTIESSTSVSAHPHHSYHPSMLGGSRFAAEAGGFPGFCLQPQMQQEYDGRDGLLCRRLLPQVVAAEETPRGSSITSSLAGKNFDD